MPSGLIVSFPRKWLLDIRIASPICSVGKLTASYSATQAALCANESLVEGACTMRLSRLRVTLSIVVSLLVLSSLPCRSQEKVKFPIAASSKTLGYGPLWVAWKHGFFDQQGLDAQVILLRGTPPSVQALVAGSVYVGGATPDAVMDVRFNQRALARDHGWKKL